MRTVSDNRRSRVPEARSVGGQSLVEPLQELGDVALLRVLIEGHLLRVRFNVRPEITVFHLVLAASARAVS